MTTPQDISPLSLAFLAAGVDQGLSLNRAGADARPGGDVAADLLGAALAEAQAGGLVAAGVRPVG